MSLYLSSLRNLAESVWNHPVPCTPQDISSALDVAYKAAVFAACIVPKDLLPSITLPALTALAIAKDTIPPTIQKLSEDLSLTTIAKCTVFTATHFVPLVLEQIIEQKPVTPKSNSNASDDPEFYGLHCSKGSDTEKVFQNLKDCIQQHPIADCMQYNHSVTQGVTLTLPCKGRSSQPVIHFHSTREVTLLRVDSTIRFITKGSIDKGFSGATNSLGFDNKPRLISCSPELNVQVVTYKTFTDESCVFHQKIPANLKLGPNPVCVVTASPLPEEKYITCLAEEPINFSINDGAAQYSLSSTIHPVYQEEVKTFGSQKLVNKKITSYPIQKPCQHGLLPKSQCKAINSG